MKEDLQSLLGTLEALRSELEDTKKRLSAIESVVQIYEEDGENHVCVECTSVVVRPVEDRRWISIQIDGRRSGGPFITFYHTDSDGIRAGLDLNLDEDGTPHVVLRGSDHQVRGDFFIQKDHGTLAVMGPGHKPGAVMRALPGGGSVAVLQPDGKARGVLIHDECQKSITDDGESPATELIFATGDGKVLTKLHVDNEGSLLAVGHPGQLNSALLCSRAEGGSLILNSPTLQNGVVCTATDDLSMVSAHQGTVPGEGPGAALSAGADHSSLDLRDRDHIKRVEIKATEGIGSVALHDCDPSNPAVVMSHHEGSHSSLAMAGVAGHDCLRFVANQDVAALNLASPQNEKTKVMVSTLEGDKPSVLIQRNGKVQTMMGCGDNGGLVIAYGAEKEKAGFATLSGGPNSGSLLLQSPDGIPQLTIDATDHGGRMLIHNDIGFQRIAMGTFQESSGIVLNHTGSDGVAISALENGGIVTVFDNRGEPIQTLPDRPPGDLP
ncbi:MAG: hypothetical protein KDM64_01520 [Verrucomicrobiae bacterium]|nr:hypothetical protein [Verrucomicrobiae bacterium]